MINQLKTLAFLSLMAALLVWIGSFWGKTGILFGLIFAVVLNFGAYFYSDKIALAVHHARKIKKTENQKLYELVKDVAHRAGLPIPKIYMIPSEMPNAFATGRDPKHAAIAFTEGILKLLDKDELRGVIAHEMSHIKNRDILITTIAATIASVISYAAAMARWSMIFGGMSRDENSSGNLLSLLVLAIITPIIALILQLAISRSREYLADETGAKMIKKPLALASALKKLSGYKIKGNTNKTYSSMYIVNPFKAENMINLLSTHPPLKERIKRLEELSKHC